MSDASETKKKTRAACVTDFLRDDPSPPKLAELREFTRDAPLSSYYDQLPDKYKQATE